MSNQNFSEEQIRQLNQPLDQKRFKTRQGGGGSTLTYLAGFDIIDTANRILGYGSWGYDIISNDLQNVLDENGQIIGAYYAARVRLSVFGCVSVTEEGVCAVQAGRNPRAMIDAHDMARKGAITDAMKRAFRVYGNQFGNPLYDKDFASSDNVSHEERPATRPAQPAAPRPTPNYNSRPNPAPAPTPSQPPKPASNGNGNGEPATDQQITAITRMAGVKGWDEIQLADRVQELYGVTLSHLTKVDAGHFIQVIQQKG